MATDWEVGPKDREQDFALGLETKQKKWCRGTAEFVFQAANTQAQPVQQSLSQGCHRQADVSTAGAAALLAWAGQGGSAPAPISHTRGQLALEGAWHSCSTAAVQGVPWAS